MVLFVFIFNMISYVVLVNYFNLFLHSANRLCKLFILKKAYIKTYHSDSLHLIVDTQKHLDPPNLEHQNRVT
jgi:hypothetical protein